jgi:hypothetical protein
MPDQQAPVQAAIAEIVASANNIHFGWNVANSGICGMTLPLNSIAVVF